MSMDVWIFAGVVAVAVGVALVWVLPPLLRTPKSHASERRDLNIAVYRDQLKDLEAERDNGALSAEQFEQSKLELEDRLSEDALQDNAADISGDRGGRWVGWTVAGLLPVLAVAVYLWRGAPDVLIQPALIGTTAQGAQGSEQVVKKALWFAGVFAYQKGEWAQAAEFWGALRGHLNEEEKQSSFAKLLDDAERDARGKAEGNVPSAGQGEDAAAHKEGIKPKAEVKPKASTGPRIEGRVELSPALKAKVGPDDTIFLFARAGENGPPLAVMKVRVSALPLNFVLDDSMAMSPEMALSTVSEVILTARVSKSGQPKLAAGDLEGKLTGVKVNAKGVQLVIDRVQP